MVALKLIVHPLLTAWLALVVFEVRPLWATVAILMAALPTGANVFVLAQLYSVYVERISAVTLLSTVLAVLTRSLLFAGAAWWMPSSTAVAWEAARCSRVPPRDAGTPTGRRCAHKSALISERTTKVRFLRRGRGGTT
jgi:hypothetical protein